MGHVSYFLSVFYEPVIHVFHGKNGEYLDLLADYIIKDTVLIHPQAILRTVQASQAFDPALADLLWPIAEMLLDCILDS
jgi:hypothetical protein